MHCNAQRFLNLSCFEKEMKEKNESHSSAKSDTIDIPVGKWLNAVRKNPWIIISIVLVIAIVVMFFWMWKPATAGPGTVTAQVAAANVISFINAQGQGTVELTGVSTKGPFYEVKVKFQNQEIPVLVSLDGNYIITNPLPITPNAPVLTPQQQPPANQIVDVEIGNSPSKGNKEAKVTLVEFTDYECPYCETFYKETYKDIVKDYLDTGKVRLIVKDFPLSNIHKNAQKASEAAHCAREQQGDAGYFIMHNKLFENQNKLTIENYKKWAKEMDLVPSKFDTCLDSGKYEKEVKDNLEYGASLGVTGTPTFFVNGKILRGAQPYATFKQILDSELGAAK